MGLKSSADVEAMAPPGMALYGRMCGGTLARAHARSGDGIAIASYLGRSDTFDRAICAFAETSPTRTSSTTAHSSRQSRAVG